MARACIAAVAAATAGAAVWSWLRGSAPPRSVPVLEAVSEPVHDAVEQAPREAASRRPDVSPIDVRSPAREDAYVATLADQQRTTVLGGRVLEEGTDRPLARARISMSHEHGGPSVSTTSEQGEYALASVPLGTDLRFVVQAEGCVTRRFAFEVRSDEPRVRRDFRLVRGREVRGVVADHAAGLGVPGARVASVETDSEGAFRDWLLPDDDGTIRLRVDASGYCSLRMDVLEHEPALDLVLRIPRTAAVEGRVTDPSGEPVAGASVGLDEDVRARDRFRRSGGIEHDPLRQLLPPRASYGSRPARATTDEHGRFRIEGVPPWPVPWRVSCSARGFVPAEVAIERGLEPGETLQRDFVLGPSSDRRGSLVARLRINGREFRGARGRVLWSGADSSGEREVRDAALHLALEPGEYAVRLELDGLPSKVEGRELDVTIAPWAETVRTIELRVPTASISGRVLLRDGRPAAGVEIAATCRTSDRADPWDRFDVPGAVAIDGTYVIDVPALERPYRVVASLHHQEAAVDGIAAGARDVDLALDPEGRLLLRIRYARDDDRAIGFDVAWSRHGTASFDPLLLRTPDADGWYEVWLPVGTIDLRGEASRNHRIARVDGVSIEPDGTARAELRLEPGFAIDVALAPGEARLLDDHRIALVPAGAWAAAGDWDATGEVDARSLRDAGNARVERLAPGLHRFDVYPPDLVIDPPTVLVGEHGPKRVEIRWRRVE